MLCAQIGPLCWRACVCLRDADQQEWSRGMHRAEDDGLRDADRPARPATRHRRPPRTSPQSLHTQSREKKRLPSPSPPADAVSHGKPDAPIRPDRRPFLRASTQSSPRATQGRSRGCKVRTAPEATSTHLVCIMRSSITIPRGGGQPGVAPSVWRFARYSPMPTPR